MRSTFYLFAVLFLATTFFSCETVEPSPRPTWGEIVNPIEAFMYPRDLKVFADGEEGRRWLILVVPDSTKSSFAPTSKSTPAEVARYKELSQLVGNPTEPVANECHFHRTWLIQGVKGIRVLRARRPMGATRMSLRNAAISISIRTNRFSTANSNVAIEASLPSRSGRRSKRITCGFRGEMFLAWWLR